MLSVFIAIPNDAAAAAPKLRASTQTRQERARSAPQALESFIPFCIHTSTSLRLQCSGAPYFHVCTPTARLQTSRPPDLHSFILSLLHTCNVPPVTHTSPPPYRYTYSASPSIHISTSQFRQRVFIGRTSTSPRHHTCNASPELYNSMLPRLRASSTPPSLHASTTPRC